MLSEDDFDLITRNLQGEGPSSDSSSIDLSLDDLPKANQKAVKKPKKESTRIKLSLDVLKGERGFPYLRNNSAKLLNSLDGQPGNEGEDTKKIVQFMREWHQYVYPNGKFSEFTKNVEKLSKSKACQAYIHGELLCMSENKVMNECNVDDFSLNSIDPGVADE